MPDDLNWLKPEQRTTQHTGRNRHVMVARVVLPVIAFLVLILSVIWAQMGPSVDVKKIDMKQVQNTLETARFTSIDKDGQPFVIEADKVIQQDPSSMAAQLAGPKGEVKLKNGSNLRMQAKDGLYNHNAQTLKLNGDVVLNRDKDMTMKTEALDVNLSDNSASGDKPVSAVTTKGDTLNAQGGVDMKDNGDKIIFKGPATLTLAPKSQKLEE